MDDKTFTDLFALGSALPGPSFSQVYTCYSKV